MVRQAALRAVLAVVVVIDDVELRCEADELAVIAGGTDGCKLAVAPPPPPALAPRVVCSFLFSHWWGKFPLKT